jgi:homopolymeric O-antigen transport system ATP-binding protein
MSELAIRVENLGKRYRIGHLQQRHDTLRDQISDFGKRAARAIRKNGNASHGDSSQSLSAFRLPPSDFIWALKDVSFEVKRGEVVGIIGRNGAGKSTLLKILSRITEPTEGGADIYGRVGTLLEVGTGFHPELTGRENIYLSGAILGMKRAEIERKFDEIVAFAEIEKFVDTPVKRYSSGMYVRLAFAVAAHLEPEILMVDEVLSVGDAAFQKKCLGKMGDVAREGRTVLFVSHNMAAIKSLCTRAILLTVGSVSADGDVPSIAENYMLSTSAHAKPGLTLAEAPRRYSTGQARFRSIQMFDSKGIPATQLYLGESLCISLSVRVLEAIREAAFEVTLVASDGVEAASTRTLDWNNTPIALSPGEHIVSAQLNVFLLPRHYSMQLIMHRFDGAIIDWVDDALDFEVLNMARDTADSYRYWPVMRGYVRIPARWEIKTLSPGRT